MATRAPIAMPNDEREQARELRELLESGPAFVIGAKGDRREIPTHAHEVLKRAVALMLKGQAVSVVPVNRTLTTKAAADMLGVSRPFLVNLLKTGKIPFETVGTHRRVKYGDLLHYQSEQARIQRSALERMTRAAAELGLYGEPCLPEGAEVD